MDLWSHALVADSFQDELNVLMAFASMQRDGTSVLAPRLLSRDVPNRLQYFVPARSWRHREREYEL
jgi:hypothetical protein